MLETTPIEAVWLAVLTVAGIAFACMIGAVLADAFGRGDDDEGAPR